MRAKDRRACAVIGCGSLGSCVFRHLAFFGLFSRITLVDYDRVAPHNLSNQPLYRSTDVDRYKVDVLGELHPRSKVYRDRFEDLPLDKCVCDLYFVCVDSLDARKIVFDCCLQRNPSAIIIEGGTAIHKWHARRFSLEGEVACPSCYPDLYDSAPTLCSIRVESKTCHDVVAALRVSPGYSLLNSSARRSAAVTACDAARIAFSQDEFLRHERASMEITPLSTAEMCAAQMVRLVPMENMYVCFDVGLSTTDILRNNDCSVCGGYTFLDDMTLRELHDAVGPIEAPYTDDLMLSDLKSVRSRSCVYIARGRR
ncbi:hypothetical protein PCE1_001167 [Barthelona sp. PCE]